MRLKLYKVGIVDGKYTAGELGHVDIISFIKKSTDMQFKGGNMKPSQAQITTTQDVKSNLFLQIENQWYSVIHSESGMIGLKRHYLKEEPSPERFT